jgi:hypothetical protein
MRLVGTFVKLRCNIHIVIKISLYVNICFVIFGARELLKVTVQRVWIFVRYSAFASFVSSRLWPIADDLDFPFPVYLG